MCEYCGCQSLDVIAELTAEHDRLRDLGRELGRAAHAEDANTARTISQMMRDVLGPHTLVEEGGLFPAMRADFTEQIDALTGEHRVIDSMLAELDSPRPAAGWSARAHVALNLLFEHILKEQDGVFPASLTTLRAHDWATVAEVRRQAGSPPAIFTDTA